LSHSGAAVARSWGEKVVSWTDTVGITIWAPLNPSSGINIFAGVMMFLSVLLLMGGVELGKETVNIFTMLKMILVLFMIVAGLSFFKSENLTNMAPKGVNGILRGATSAFFGYLGYDEVIFYFRYLYMYDLLTMFFYNRYAA
jgi:amino acid transporter